MFRRNCLSLYLSAVAGVFLSIFAGPSVAQAIVAVHGLKVGQCVQYTDFSGTHQGIIAEAENAGGYQVRGNVGTVPVGANSRDIQPCSAETTAIDAAAVVPAAAATGGFQIGDCVQFSYGGGWETGTIAKVAVAGAYQVNWGAIVVPASANPKDIRACPAATMAVDAATAAALAKLPKGPGIGPLYGTRNPVTCADRKMAITTAAAERLVACEKEGLLGDTLYLITDVVVRVGHERAFNYNQDSAATAIDVKQPVYDISGSYTVYQCAPLSAQPNAFAKTHNCFRYPATPGGYGRCYTNTFGDKHCVMTGGGPTQLKDQIPPPAS